jgi:hypothetical protein
MAHEAFALSPISARAAQSGEGDYDAIREAFMETARGRWFLGEYAKRNRQTDTRMVLDAVARIERMLEAAQQPSPGTRLREILAILSNAINQAAETVDNLTIAERLASIRERARILKKISWRWREIGGDSRICDSIDSQVDAIQESCSQLAAVDVRTALTGAFELIRTRIEALAEDDGKAVPSTADTEAAVAATKPRSAAAARPAATEDDGPAHRTMAAPDGAASNQENCLTPVADVVTPPERAETADAQDQAIPGLLAIAIEDHCWGDAADKVVVEPAQSEPVIVAEPVERGATRARRYVVSPRTQPEAAAAPRPHPDSSLGSTPFASEFPEQRRPPGTDPVPSIRRMSLIEKIEFFS